METKSDSHSEAVDRFEAARNERDRRVEEHDQASGPDSDLTSFTELKNAEDQFAAREAWLNWVERDY